jgi:hypothetical protein
MPDAASTSAIRAVSVDRSKPATASAVPSGDQATLCSPSWNVRGAVRLTNSRTPPPSALASMIAVVVSPNPRTKANREPSGAKDGALSMSYTSCRVPPPSTGT